MEYLIKPLTLKEIKERMDENHYVKANIVINLDTIIDCNFEELLNTLSYSLIGNELLMDINYKVVGFEDGDVIILEVSGDVSTVLEEEDE